jgi:hypothetical protein
MPVAQQLIRACVSIHSLFNVNEQVMIQCLPSNDLSDTSTVLPERGEIAKYFNAFGTQLFPSTKEASFFH